MANTNKPTRNSNPIEDDERTDTELKEGIDYYLEDGLFVFTSVYLLKRGYCCESGCRHCPYGYTADNRQNKTSDLR